MAAEFLFILHLTSPITFENKKFLLRRVTHEPEAGSKRERQSGHMMYDDREKRKENFVFQKKFILMFVPYIRKDMLQICLYLLLPCIVFIFDFSTLASFFLFFSFYNSYLLRYFSSSVKQV